MFNIKPDQHAQILGWTVIGYGLSFVYAALLPMLQLASIGTHGNIESAGQVLWPTIVGYVLIAIFCFIAGSGIKYTETTPRSECLLFAVVTVGFFPLGTLLSIYALVYLFVIYPNNDGLSPSEINE
jgi:hypothetical protein